MAMEESNLDKGRQGVNDAEREEKVQFTFTMNCTFLVFLLQITQSIENIENLLVVHIRKKYPITKKLSN